MFLGDVETNLSETDCWISFSFFLFSSGLVAFHCVLDGLDHVAIRIDVLCESLQTVLSLLGFEFRSLGFFFPEVFW